jgi:fructokinase
VILVCGEALIDLFAQSGKVSGPTFHVMIGGSPLNVATGLVRLGTPAAFFGGVSTDYLGTLLVDAMRQGGIDTTLIKRSARPTPLVLVTPNSGGNPSYKFYAHESAEQDVSLVDLPPKLPVAIEALALGSYALATEPVGTALLTLAKREARRVVVSLDCNLRPTMVGALDAWRDRIEHFARTATIIKLSEEDFVTGWGEKAQFGDFVARWLAQGVRLVVLTCGASGATVWHQAGHVHLPGRRIEVVDTIGAGDSFHAALLARLAQRNLLSHDALKTLDMASIEDALGYAVFAAGITCSRQGANLPRRVEVEAEMAGQDAMTANRVANTVSQR